MNRGARGNSISSRWTWIGCSFARSSAFWQSSLAASMSPIDPGNPRLRKPFGPANREQRQGMARDHEFLIGRNDVETDATISCGDRRGGCRIGLGIERAPKPGERLHDACSEGRRVLADSRSEHEGVEPPKGRSQQACLESDPIDEEVEREPRMRVGTRFQLAHVVAEARQALQSAVAI